MAFPATLTLVTVGIRFDRAPSGGATGWVDFTMTRPLLGAADNSIIPPDTWRATLDTDGTASIQLPATNDPQWSPAGWSYTVEARIGGHAITGTLQLDHQSPSAQLADLLQVDGAAVAGTSYLLAAQRGVASGVAALDADGDIVNVDGDKALTTADLVRIGANPRPADYGWLTWSQAPTTVATTSATLTSGALYLTRVPVRATMTLSTAWLISPTIGTPPTTVELSIFTADGTRRALSANAAASFSTTGVKSVSLASPYTVPTEGWVWAGILVVGGSVNLVRASSVSLHILNPGLTAATAMFATAGTGLTGTPSSITPASNTLASTGEGWWVALA